MILDGNPCALENAGGKRVPRPPLTKLSGCGVPVLVAKANEASQGRSLNGLRLERCGLP